jgi:hypothetical protein
MAINRDTNLVKVLTAELNHRGPLVSEELLLALGEMGPAAKGAAPILVKRLEDPQDSSFSPVGLDFALKALEQIDGEAAAGVKQKVQAKRRSVFLVLGNPLSGRSSRTSLLPGGSAIGVYTNGQISPGAGTRMIRPTQRP